MHTYSVALLSNYHLHHRWDVVNNKEEVIEKYSRGYIKSALFWRLDGGLYKTKHHQISKNDDEITLKSFFDNRPSFKVTRRNDYNGVFSNIAGEKLKYQHSIVMRDVFVLGEPSDAPIIEKIHRMGSPWNIDRVVRTPSNITDSFYDLEVDLSFGDEAAYMEMVLSQ